MNQLIEEYTPGKKFILVRFTTIFLFSVFAILALGTEVMDVLKEYFHVRNFEAYDGLIIVTFVYWLILGTILFEEVIRPRDDTRFKFFVAFMLFGIPFIILYFSLTSRFPPPLNYLPGELERRANMVRIIVGATVVINAFGTAVYDFQRVTKRMVTAELTDD